MMTVSLDDEEENAVHDQLPSVEEYKASLGSGSQKLDPKKLMDQENIVNADDDFEISGDHSYNSEDEFPEDNSDGSNLHPNSEFGSGRDEESVIHGQLPTVEEIHAQRTKTSSGGSCCTKTRIGIFLLVVFFLCAIILPVILINTQANSSARKQEIESFLLDKNLTQSFALDDPGSPQHKAVLFLASEDFDNSELSDEKLTERYALTVFYYATGGPTWRYKMNFLEPTDACLWHSFFMNSKNDDITQEGAICDTDKRVRALEIPTNNLQGSLPNELQHLSNSMEQLNLRFNPGLTGEFPTGYQRLSNLWDIQLQYCSLTGQLPSYLGSQLPLRLLGVSNNLLTGTVPASIMSSTSLQILALDDNDLHADIADFTGLTKIKDLYLEDNKFTGELTDSLISSWPSIKELDLSNNKIKSTLPANLFTKMEFLKIMDLHGNQFYGPIPDTALPEHKLVFLALHDNELTGTIPDSITGMTTLEHLDVSRNQLSSTISSSLSNLKNLRYLFVGSNSYDAQEIPSFLMELSNLRELSIKQANLIGQIPASIGKLSMLQVLDLDQNDLTGEIPREIGDNMSGLDHLMLNRNKLTGTIPASFSKLADLEWLLLDHNQLTGSASPICDVRLLKYFVTDCGKGVGSGENPNPLISCPCCHLCCHARNVTCNMLDWHVNLDPIWEYSFDRFVYEFSQNPVPLDDPADV